MLPVPTAVPLARRVIAERAGRGPFTSMLDLAVRCSVGPEVTAAFNDRLLFLPPPDRLQRQVLQQQAAMTPS